MIQVSFKLQNNDIAMAKMNKDLCKVCNWCFRNYLQPNPNKSKLTVFGTIEMLPKLQDITLSLFIYLFIYYYYYRLFSLSRNKKINREPSSGKSYEIMML